MKRECDRLFSLYVRMKAKACHRCGRFRGLGPEHLECAHVLSRRFNRTRWNEDNAFALCQACHRFLGSGSMSGKATPMDRFFEAKRGAPLLWTLRALARVKTKFYPDTVEMLRWRALSVGAVLKPIPERDIPF